MNAVTFGAGFCGAQPHPATDSMLLARTEDTVARVTQPGDNVAITVEMAVDGSGINIDIGMLVLYGRNALGRRHQHQSTDGTRAGLLEQIYGGHHGAA